MSRRGIRPAVGRGWMGLRGPALFMLGLLLLAVHPGHAHAGSHASGPEGHHGSEHAEHGHHAPATPPEEAPQEAPGTCPTCVCPPGAGACVGLLMPVRTPPSPPAASAALTSPATQGAHEPTVPGSIFRPPIR
jgi:hypothetical protein